MFSFGGIKKDKAVDDLTLKMKLKAQELCKSLDALASPSQQPVVVPMPVPIQPVVEMPKRLKDKMKFADEQYEKVQRMSVRAGWLARIYKHI